MKMSGLLELMNAYMLSSNTDHNHNADGISDAEMSMSMSTSAANTDTASLKAAMKSSTIRRLELREQLSVEFTRILKPILQSSPSPWNDSNTRDKLHSEKQLQENTLHVITELYNKLHNANEDIQQIFVDTLWLLWHSTDTNMDMGMDVDHVNADAVPSPPSSSSLLHGLSRDRLIQVTRELYDKEVVAHHLVKQTLSEEFIESLMIYGPRQLANAFMRTRTIELYSQTKFNLCREESEGYSKVITELSSYFNASNDPDRAGGIAEDSSLRERDNIIGKIKSLIGYFAIDPNRMIDIVIQVYSEYVDRVDWNDTNRLQGHIQKFLQIMKLFNKLSITHVVGFRFRSYYTEKQVIADQFYHIVVILIVYNVIDLSYLYPHLAPTDEWIAIARREAVRSEIERASKVNVVSLTKDTAGDDADAGNLLSRPLTASSSADNINEDANPAAAAAGKQQSAVTTSTASSEAQLSTILSPAIIPSVTLTSGAISYGTIEVVTGQQNQKLQLLRWLLHHADIRHAYKLLHLLSEAMPCGEPDVGIAMCTYIARLTDPIYDSLQHYSTRSILRQSQFTDPTFTIAKLLPTSTFSGYVDYMQQSKDIEVNHETFDGNNNIAYVLHALLPLLRHLSIYIANDVKLYTRLVRITSTAIQQIIPQQEGVKDETMNGQQQSGWIQVDHVREVALPEAFESLVCDVILPPFTLIRSQSALSYDMFSILSQLPYTERYKIYGYWHDSLYWNSKTPELLTQHANVIYRTKYFRKRISTEKTKELGRLLAKFTLNNPTIVFDLLLQQVSSFDNMIIPVIESMKYMTPLAFDVCSWVLLRHLAADKPKLKTDGMNEAHWYQSLTSFAGQLLRRYPEIELEGYIQYIIAQLKNDQSIELLLLKEILSTMGGVDSFEGQGVQSLDGRAGGRILQQETVTVRQPKINRNRCVKAILNALIGTSEKPKNLLFPLYVLLSQQKGAIIHNAESEHVRMIGEFNDKCQEVMLQYTDFIDMNITNDVTLAEYFPSLYELVHTYHVTYEDAFHMLRRCLNLARIQSPPNHGVAAAEVNASTVDTEANGVVANESRTSSAPLVETCTTLLPDGVWQAMPAPLFAVFWKLSIHQIHVPSATYEGTKNKYKQQIATLEALSKENNNKLDDMKSKELDRMRKLLSKLNDEHARQSSEYQQTLNMLKKEKDQWFRHIDKSLNDSMSAFVSTCILPRILISLTDAFYGSQFIHLLQSIHTPSFNMPLLYNILITSVAPLLASTSPNESRRVGVFMKHVLHHINLFASNKDYYNQHARSSPGFASASEQGTDKRIEYEQFQNLVHVIWYKLLCTTIVLALRSSSQMEQTNALQFLNMVSGEYPRYASHSVLIEREVASMMEKSEKQSALKLLSTSVHARLQTNRKSVIKDIAAPTPQAQKQKPPPPSTSATTFGMTPRGATPTPPPTSAATRPTTINASSGPAKSAMKAATPMPTPTPTVGGAGVTGAAATSKSENATGGRVTGKAVAGTDSGNKRVDTKREPDRTVGRDRASMQPAPSSEGAKNIAETSSSQSSATEKSKPLPPSQAKQSPNDTTTAQRSESRQQKQQQQTSPGRVQADSNGVKIQTPAQLPQAQPQGQGQRRGGRRDEKEAQAQAQAQSDITPSTSTTIPASTLSTPSTAVDRAADKRTAHQQPSITTSTSSQESDRESRRVSDRSRQAQPQVQTHPPVALNPSTPQRARSTSTQPTITGTISTLGTTPSRQPSTPAASASPSTSSSPSASASTSTSTSPSHGNLTSVSPSLSEGGRGDHKRRRGPENTATDQRQYQHQHHVRGDVSAPYQQQPPAPTPSSNTHSQNGGGDSKRPRRDEYPASQYGALPPPQPQQAQPYYGRHGGGGPGGRDVRQGQGQQYDRMPSHPSSQQQPPPPPPPPSASRRRLTRR